MLCVGQNGDLPAGTALDFMIYWIGQEVLSISRAEHFSVPDCVLFQALC
jgi:hypothetical protein